MKAMVSFGRVGGIPIGSHWSALLGVVFVLSLPAHETAHALVARRARKGVRSPVRPGGGFPGRTAGTERVHGALPERLGSLRAGDVMTPRPYLASGWWTVQALVEQLLGPDGPRRRAFPVIDFRGRLVGRLHLAEIAAIDPAARPTTTVAEVARPVRDELVVDVDTPLEQVLQRPHGPGREIVVVGHDGRVVGLIAVTDLQRSAELEALRSDGTSHRVPWNGSFGWE